jgi:predicted transcriptional regulator
MMDKPPCENIAKSYLPALRSIIARKLIYDYNHSQIQVAEKLGTTQAAVSQYISSKRGMKTKEIEKNSNLQDAIQNITEKIATDGKPTIFSEQVCDLCKLIQTLTKSKY